MRKELLEPFQFTEGLKIENFAKNQRIYFNCENCKKRVEMYLYYLLKRKNFLCKTCKTKKTNLQKYGSSTPAGNEKIRQKMHSTCLERYGVENAGNSKLAREKAKQTCLKKYGTMSTFASEKIKQKIKQTNLKKYGVEHPAQNESVKRRIKNTWIKNGGAPAQRIDVQQKMHETRFKKNKGKYESEKAKNQRKETMLKRYGVENAFKSKQIQQKIKQTNLKKYGVEVASQSDVAKEHHRKTMQIKYGSTHPYSAHYRYDNYYFDSAWELALWIYAKDHNEEILREPESFEFQHNGKIFKYIPDFKYLGNLIEVKGDHFFEDQKMINPYDRSLDEIANAKYQCALQHGVKFFLKKDIQKYLDYIQSQYGLTYLNNFKA